MGELQFVKELPFKRRGQGRHDWSEIAAACRAHPGLWADVIQLGPNTGPAYYYARGRREGLEVAVTKQDGQTHVYVRWVQQ